jgi:hypothetical protein
MAASSAQAWGVSKTLVIAVIAYVNQLAAPGFFKPLAESLGKGAAFHQFQGFGHALVVVIAQDHRNGATVAGNTEAVSSFFNAVKQGQEFLPGFTDGYGFYHFELSVFEHFPCQISVNCTIICADWLDYIILKWRCQGVFDKKFSICLKKYFIDVMKCRCMKDVAGGATAVALRTQHTGGGTQPGEIYLLPFFPVILPRCIGASPCVVARLRSSRSNRTGL